MSCEILLTSLNSTYQHASLGLRYLLANMKEMRSSTEMLEFTINQNPRDIAEKILAQSPLLVGFGVYIWNARQTEEVVQILKSVQPTMLIVLGGPEVSHAIETQSILQYCDYVIQGEGDSQFYQFCKNWRQGELPAKKVIAAELPHLHELCSPYAEYSEEDLKNRVLYVEASRGCPYKCEYCLSSLDKSVRNFPIEAFLKDLESLLSRGARQFKFVDRTFNLSPKISQQILQFFLDRLELGLFLHFEMVPDRLPVELRALIEKFPPGCLQFEVGIQTWSPLVAANVSRRQNYQLIGENLTYLRTHTSVHSHADLIVGLPGETLQSFADGFDALANLHPDEIQVGLLKRLKGTPIVRHDEPYAMIYQKNPPFQILQNKDLSFSQMQRMSRFSKFWDLYANSGHFLDFMALLRQQSLERDPPSFFWEFFSFVEFLETRHAEGHGISLIHLFESAFSYLCLRWPEAMDKHRTLLVADYLRDKKRDIPKFLRLPESGRYSSQSSQAKKTAPPRQRRHQSLF